MATKKKQCEETEIEIEIMRKIRQVKETYDTGYCTISF